MNITLLTNRDLASNVALNYLYGAIGQEHTLRVLLSAQVGKSPEHPSLPKDLRALRFVEQSLFNDILFPALGIRHNRTPGKLMSFDELAYQGVAIQDIASINCEQGIATLKAGSPELIISIRFGLILKQPVFNIARYGIINLHSGLLPDYRGVMACFRAMENNDPEIATTLHYISDSGIDTGNIIAINRLAVNYHASYLENLLALYEAGVDSIVALIPKIQAQGTIDNHRQHDGGNYYTFPSETELQAFADKGLSLVKETDSVAFSRLYF